VRAGWVGGMLQTGFPLEPAQGWIVIAAWTAALIPVAALAYRRAAVRA